MWAQFKNSNRKAGNIFQQKNKKDINYKITEKVIVLIT